MLLSRRSYMPDLRVESQMRQFVINDQMLTSQNTHDLLTSRRANSERRSENQLLPKNCIFNILNPYFQNDGLRQCAECKIVLCFYCQLNCKHPIKHYNISYTGSYIKSDGECKCCELHIPQSYITFIQDQTKRFKNNESLKLCQLFNQTLNDTELFHYFYYPLKEHFTQILDKLDYGEESQMWNSQQNGAENLNISDRIGETFHDKTFHYKSTILKLNFLNYLLKRVKDGYILPKIQDCIPQYLFTFIIQNYHLIYQHLLINNQLQDLTITILSIQYRNFKQQFSRFRMLRCQDLENSNFITRNMIREYNKSLPDSYKFAFMKELIKKANKIIFELEFSNPLLYSVVLFIFRCVKLGLRLRMFDNLKDVCKVLTGFEKLCRDIEYYNQQKHSGFIQPLENEQIFNKISEIILLAYVQFKDYKISRKIDKQLNKNTEKQQDSLYSKILHQFYDEPIKQNSMINLIYGTSEQEVETLMRIFINTIIEPNLEKLFYNQQSKKQQKLNLITQIILNEQLFIHSISYFQLYQIKLEDWLIWINNESNSQFELTLFPIIDSIQQFIQDISTKAIEIYQLSKIVKQLELLLSIKEINKLREYVVYIENKFKNNEKEFDYPLWEMKKYQKICYQMGIDNVIFNLLKVLYKNSNDQKHLLILYYDVIDLAFNVLYCMSALNSSIINQIYQSKNLETLKLLSQIPDINRKVVYFHYQLLFLNGFTVFYLYCFICPEQIIRHIYDLNQILDSTYSDSSELSITKATEIAETKIQIYILILSLFQQMQIIYNNYYYQNPFR